MLNTAPNESAIQFGNFDQRVPVAGVDSAAAPSVADLVQANPTLSALRVPKIKPTSEGDSALAEAFSRNPIAGQPSESILLDHIKALAATGHLNGDQAHYLATNRRNPVTLWKAVETLSENTLIDTANHIGSAATQVFMDSMPLTKYVRFALLWKRAYPESVSDNCILRLNKIIRKLESGQGKTFDNTIAQEAKTVAENLFEQINDFLTKTLGPTAETGFYIHAPSLYDPLAFGFGALEGFVYPLDTKEISVELWFTIKATLKLTAEIATPASTTTDIHCMDMMMDEVVDEMKIIREKLAEGGYSEDDCEAIDDICETNDMWVVTCFDEWEANKEAEDQLNVEKDRWDTGNLTMTVACLQGLVDALPKPTTDKQKYLNEWCRESLDTLKAIDTPWHELADDAFNENEYYNSHVLEGGMVVLLENDYAAHESAENCHRHLMEGGETTELTVGWDCDPYQVVTFAKCFRSGRKILESLMEIAEQ